MAALAAGFAAGALATGALVAVAFAAGAFAGAVAFAFGATAFAAVAFGAADLLAAAFGAAVLVAFGAALAAGLAAATAFAGALVGVAIQIPFKKVRFFRGASQCTAWDKCDDVMHQSKSCAREEFKINAKSFIDEVERMQSPYEWMRTNEKELLSVRVVAVAACSARALHCGSEIQVRDHFGWCPGFSRHLIQSFFIRSPKGYTPTIHVPHAPLGLCIAAQICAHI